MRIRTWSREGRPATVWAVLPDWSLTREERTDHLLLSGTGFGFGSLALSPDDQTMSYEGLLFDAHDFSVVHGAFSGPVKAFASSGDFGLLSGISFDTRLRVQTVLPVFESVEQAAPNAQ